MAKRISYRRDVLPRLDAETVYGRGWEWTVRSNRRWGWRSRRCPLCGESKAGRGRLAVDPHGLAWKCHACGASGDPPKWIAASEGVQRFPDQLLRLATLAGVDPGSAPLVPAPGPSLSESPRNGHRANTGGIRPKAGQSRGPDPSAIRTWDRALACDETPAAAYLANRLVWPVGLDGWTLPESLRWLPADRWPGRLGPLPGSAAGALVSTYRDRSGSLRALKLEALDAFGAVLAPKRVRRNLGRTDRARFTACDLPGGALHVGEGEVTALALAVQCRALGAGTAVAVGGDSGLRPARCWDRAKRPLVIHADRDAPGIMAAGSLAVRLRAAGRDAIELLLPGPPDGLDAADVLAAEVGERAAIREDGMDRSAAVAAAWPEVIEGLRERRLEL